MGTLFDFLNSTDEEKKKNGLLDQLQDKIAKAIGREAITSASDSFNNLNKTVENAAPMLQAGQRTVSPPSSPGFLAGLRHGFTGEPSVGSTIPYAIGQIPGSLFRAKAGLNVSEPDRVAQALAVEEGRMNLEENRLKKFMQENPTATTKQFTVGGETVEIPPSEQQFKQDVARKVEEKTALEKVSPPSQAQEVTGLYTKRLEQAEKVFGKLEKQLSHLGVGAAVMQAKGPLNIGIPNWAKSADAQSYEQAKRNFLNAVLRKESGAVISPTEFSEGNAQYFPQPGDKKDVIAQKKENRRIVIESMKRASGKAYFQDPLIENVTTSGVKYKRISK